MAMPQMAMFIWNIKTWENRMHRGLPQNFHTQMTHQAQEKLMAGDGDCFFFFVQNLLFVHLWLVVAANPSEKWWSESQLGWWHPQYMEEKNMFQTTNQISVSNDFWQSTLRLQCFENGGLSDTDEPPPFAGLYQRNFPLFTFIWSSLFQWWNHLQSFAGPQSPIINHSSSSIYRYQ